MMYCHFSFIEDRKSFIFRNISFIVRYKIRIINRFKGHTCNNHCTICMLARPFYCHIRTLLDFIFSLCLQFMFTFLRRKQTPRTALQNNNQMHCIETVHVYINRKSFRFEKISFITVSRANIHSQKKTWIIAFEQYFELRGPENKRSRWRF